MGIFVLIISGLCQGSFGLGYKKYDPLSWEAFWGVYSLFCGIDAFIWTLIVQPGLFDILGSAGTTAILIPALCGAVWGLSTLAFSKSVLVVGMSLCFGVNMGVSSVVGTLIPFFTGANKPSAKSILFLALGIVITLVGIVIITKAGLMKEKASNGGDNGDRVKAAAGSTMFGVILAIVSGLCSGIMNVGFDKAAVLSKDSPNFVAQAAVQWLPVLGAGMLCSMLACLILCIKRKSLNTFGKKGTPKTLLKLYGTSLIWFAALILYGIASKLLGDYGSSIGWLVFNAIALVVSSMWGVVTGEWKGHKGPRKLLFIGDAVLLVSWILIMQV